MPFSIVRQDITKINVDAIVNAANVQLQMGGGVCGAIFKAAGAKDLQAACNKLGSINTGEAVITPGFKLPAKYVIHTAGPIYRDGKQGEEEQLRACYMNSLRLALDQGCESIAFPLISSGIYGYPKEKALQVATSAIKEFIVDHDINVFLLIFDMEAFTLSEKLLGEVEAYIDDHYAEAHLEKPSKRILADFEEKLLSRLPAAPSIGPGTAVGGVKVKVPSASEAPTVIRELKSESLDSLIDNLDESFSESLLRLIDAKGKTDVEVYKKANIDRKLFSKIRTGKGYNPGKATVLALAIALELNLSETEALLKRAGYALSNNRKFDVIIEFFIMNGRYDIFEINEVLFKYDQPILGA